MPSRSGIESRLSIGPRFLFHHHVFGAGRNNLGVGLLARISHRTYRRGDNGTGGAVCSLKAVDCPAIDGIIEEADEVAGEVADKSVLDAALIDAAQAAEHYEITRYGSLIAWAKQLGRNDCASVLQKSLDEERATDKKLTTLAESRINLRAAS